MIYIHCENLGLLERHIGKLDINEATAKNFSWMFRLSTEPTSNNRDTTVVKMPDFLADALIWSFIDNNSDFALSFVLSEMLEIDGVRKMFREQLDDSIYRLDFSKRYPPDMGDGTTMAHLIEHTWLDEYEEEIFALLDAQGFVRAEG